MALSQLSWASMALPVLIIIALGNFCWVYGGVLTVMCFRAVARTDAREHVGHFVGLMAVFVPGIASVFVILFIGWALQSAWILSLVLIAFPGALAVGLHLEVMRLTDKDPAKAAPRMVLTILLALGMTAFSLP
ncbi:MAG: hypothetical protein AAGF74_03155 [Pseudomonadota bacterium]